MLTFFLTLCTKLQQTCSFKGQIVNIVGFSDHRVFVVTALFYQCITNAAIDGMKTNKHNSLPIKLYLKKQMVATFGLWAGICPTPKLYSVLSEQIHSQDFDYYENLRFLPVFSSEFQTHFCLH